MQAEKMWPELMRLNQLLFQLEQDSSQAHFQSILAIIKELEMGDFMTSLSLKYPALFPQSSVASVINLVEVKAKNQSDLAALSAKLEDAKQNFGETEIFEALLAIANFHCQIGSDLSVSLGKFDEAMAKAVGTGARLDILLSRVRLCFFHRDSAKISSELAAAKKLLEDGGADWERRNKLKVYEAVYLLSIRNFKQASDLFLESLATFTATEFLDYKQFVKYTVLSSILYLDRNKMKEKIIDGPEVLEVVHEIAHLQDYVQSLYQCRYGQFLRCLASIETDYLKFDVHLNKHYRWYVKEMRILAYNQLLESYRSVTVDSMAKSFGISTTFLDKDLSAFIASGRIHANIDKVAGLVETTRPDSKNVQYIQLVKQGDQLLNRIQKLSRVINV